MTRSHNLARTAFSLGSVSALLVALAMPTSVFAQECGNNTPASPVPECRDPETTAAVDCSTVGAIRLWPADLRPGAPEELIPAIRDTTDRIGGQTVPGARTGHELFKSVDVVGDHLYVAYNAGIQAWDISGANAETPSRLGYQDGWSGDFLSFPPPGETLTVIEDIAVRHIEGTSKDLIAVSGKAPVGPSLWTFDTTLNRFEQLYQDTGSTTRQVRIGVLNNVYYAFMATDSGIVLYNASYARDNLTNPCTDFMGTICPGVYRGPFPDQQLGRFLDVFEANNKIYVTSSNPVYGGLELWEFTAPVTPVNGVLKYKGTGELERVRGTAMFEYGGNRYLAMVHEQTVKIYDIDVCINTPGLCSSLGTQVPQTPLTLPSWSSSEQFLTYSESNGTPFLYYGLNSYNIDGSAIEQLFNISSLGSSLPIIEITASGGTYVDQCNGKTVDYWGDYYQKNDHGLNAMHPRVGKFSGNYFYRAAQTILDVHVRGGGAPPPTEDPTITTTATDAPPYWFDKPVSFAATAANCAGAEIWEWFADDTAASGLGPGSSTAAITWYRCGTGDCPTKNIEVWALKDACSGDPALIQHRATVTVSDPWPRVRQIAVSPPSERAGEYPVCSVLSFSATVDGMSPFTYEWEARDSQGVPLASSGQATLQWDTSGYQFDGLFLDGFELGDTSRWSGELGTEEFPSASANREIDGGDAGTADWRDLLKATGNALITIEVKVTNPDGEPEPPASSSTEIILTSLGELGFGDPPINVTDLLGGGQFQFSANVQNTTTWRWELEDPINGESTSCQAGYSRCHVVEWGSQVQISYSWPLQDTAKQYGVTVWIGNCEAENTLSAATAVDVPEGGDPPVMTSFSVASSSIQTISDPNRPCKYTCAICNPRTVECTLGQDVTFSVTASGDFNYFKFDWDNNGTYEVSVPAASTVTHSFNSTGLKQPKAKASFGSLESAPRNLTEELTIVTSIK